MTRGITTRPPTSAMRVQTLSRTVFALDALAMAVFVRQPEARRSIRMRSVIRFDARGASVPTLTTTTP